MRLAALHLLRFLPLSPAVWVHCCQLPCNSTNPRSWVQTSAALRLPLLTCNHYCCSISAFVFAIMCLAGRCDLNLSVSMWLRFPCPSNQQFINSWRNLLPRIGYVLILRNVKYVRL
jgi:hypothetical protein